MRSRRLSYRALTQTDAAAVAAISGDWDVARMTARIPYPYSVRDAEGWIASVGDGTGEFVRGIEHDSVLIGACGYVVYADGAAEIGYWIARSRWGQGFATEAGRALVGHCFRSAGFRRLTCCHFTDNPASQRVIEKLGFRLIGPAAGWSDARQHEAPILRYEQWRTWAYYLTLRTARPAA